MAAKTKKTWKLGREENGEVTMMIPSVGGRYYTFKHKCWTSCIKDEIWAHICLISRTCNTYSELQFDIILS